MKKLFFLLILVSFISTLHAVPQIFRRKEELTCIASITEDPKITNDINLVTRIVNAYRLSKKHHLGNSMWQIFFDQRQKPIHDIFESNDIQKATAILRYPTNSEHFYGIDSLSQSLFAYDYPIRQERALCCFDTFIRFGEAIGAFNLDNPDQYPSFLRKWDINSVLDNIEKHLNLTLHFPNPYPFEIGILTKRGLFSYRAIQSLYQAYLIKTLVKNIPNPKILEIGAGLGRTAYYARMFGIKDYTIIDLPMTAAASSYFLGRTLGEDQVILYGENSDNVNEKVKILTPDQFIYNYSEKYDLIINADSLTEMDINTAEAYIRTIEQVSSIFVSINHEVNPFTVNQITEKSSYFKKSIRYPYWMRSGYVEEIYMK